MVGENDFGILAAHGQQFVHREGANIRSLVDMLPDNNMEDAESDCTDDLNRIIPNLDGFAKDARAVLQNIADNNVFVEVKKDYAKDMVLGLIKLNGATVGCVANQAADGGELLSTSGAYIAADFVKFCDAFNIPVLTLVNAKGFVATVSNERTIADAAAKLTYAFADATVPKVTVVMGDAFGTAYTIMNSKAIGADITYAWPDAKIGTMDAKLAAKIICDGQDAAAIDACAAEYEALQTSAESAAQRGYVDQIIEAADTRKYVIGAFEMLFTKREDGPVRKHGTV